MESTKVVLADSLQGLKRNLHYVLLLILLISLPIALVQTCVVDTRIDLDGITQVIHDTQAQIEAGEPITSEGAFADASKKLLIYYGITMLLSSFSLIVQVSVMLMIRNHKQGAPTVFRDVFEASVRLFPKVWLTQLLGSLLMAIGLMFCILPGIFMYFVFYMVPYGVVYTELWGRKGLFVSSLYSRKYGRKVLVMILSGMLYSFVISWIIQESLGLLPNTGLLVTVSGTVAYCLQDLLACIPTACFSGMALSMDLEVDFSKFSKK